MNSSNWSGSARHGLWPPIIMRFNNHQEVEYREDIPIFSNVSTSIPTSFFTVFNLLMIIEPPDDRVKVHVLLNLTNYYSELFNW